MRITIVMGFFLPMPPAAGGATEKSWDRLAQEFAARGHQVTILSRQWPQWPNDERINGVRYVRLPGDAHTSDLKQNLWRDFRWSRRVGRVLPAADITVVNCVALPVWLGWKRGHTGKLVVMPGRVPKGQYRLYRRLDRVLAVSSPVREAVLKENPSLAPVTRVFGYPIAWAALAEPTPARGRSPVTIGYIGRIHREKGLELFADAIARLARRTNLPAWRVLVCGPADVSRGGSGPEFANKIRSSLVSAAGEARVDFREPVFNEPALAATYREIDVFCYPSLAEQGETFGVAVAEAMAAGAVPVVSQLECFRDFVRPGENGFAFDHRAADAADLLADALAQAVGNESSRAQLAENGRLTVRDYDFPHFAARLLADFSTLK